MIINIKKRYFILLLIGLFSCLTEVQGIGFGFGFGRRGWGWGRGWGRPGFGVGLGFGGPFFGIGARPYWRNRYWGGPYYYGYPATYRYRYPAYRYYSPYYRSGYYYY